MDSKEAIIQATTELINEKGDRLAEITMREISKRANVGLGLINYHFENKDHLIELCVERIVNGVVEQFDIIRENTDKMTPFEKLEYLGNMTLSFLFDHYAVSRISMLTDLRAPKEDDNTHRTYRAYLPLVAACRPDWDEKTVERKTFILISVMQHSFLRHEEIRRTQGIDLCDKDAREKYHTQILHSILDK